MAIDVSRDLIITVFYRMLKQAPSVAKDLSGGFGTVCVVAVEVSNSLVETSVMQYKSAQPMKRQSRGYLGVLRPAVLTSGLMLAIGYASVLFLGGGPTTVVAEHSGDTPAVIELFTSQGCYSCPPAEALLGELVESNDLDHLVALEFHVDYWDSLVYGSHGSHQDPFSSPDNTLRQQTYNRDLEGRTGVYTPQMVVNGRFAAIGSKRRNVQKGIDLVERPSVVIDVAETIIEGTDTGKTNLSIDMSGDYTKVPSSAHVWLAVFDIEETTKITTGENHDKSLVSHHIVREFNSVTPHGGYSELLASDGSFQINVEVELGEGQGCAVLFQEMVPGPIHGAAYCPESVWKASAG